MMANRRTFLKDLLWVLALAGMAAAVLRLLVRFGGDNRLE